MSIVEGLERTLPDQTINRGTIFLTDQKINSAPSKKTPLSINDILKCIFSQGVNFREFPNSVKDIFFGDRQPQDRWYRTAVLITSAAVGFGLSVATVSLLDPQTPSLIRTVFNLLLERIP